MLWYDNVNQLHYISHSYAFIHVVIHSSIHTLSATKYIAKILKCHFLHILTLIFDVFIVQSTYTWCCIVWYAMIRYCQSTSLHITFISYHTCCHPFINSHSQCNKNIGKIFQSVEWLTDCFFFVNAKRRTHVNILRQRWPCCEVVGDDE